MDVGPLFLQPTRLAPVPPKPDVLLPLGRTHHTLYGHSSHEDS